MQAKKKSKTLPDSKQLTLTGLFNKDRVAQAHDREKDQSNDAESEKKNSLARQILALKRSGTFNNNNFCYTVGLGMIKSSLSY